VNFGQSQVQTPFENFTLGQGVATPFGAVGGTAPRVEIAAGKGPEPLSEVLPAYPPLAAQARVQGVVALEVQIGTKGSVDNIRVITGHPLLIQAAIDAVKTWVYPPQASPGTTTVALNFHF
jgi:TonB family protein